MYITLANRNSQKHLPIFIHRIFTEECNLKEPMKPIYSSDWLFYNHHINGIPVPIEYRLPKHLYMICKGVKRFEHDFFTDEGGYWVVSSKFHAFLRNYNFFDGYYEECPLDILSTKFESISSQKHFLMRFYKFDDEFIDFDKSEQVKPSKGPGKPRAFYNSLTERNESLAKDIYIFNESSLKYSIVMNKSVMSLFSRMNFIGFDIVDLKKFTEEMLFRDQNH